MTRVSPFRRDDSRRVPRLRSTPRRRAINPHLGSTRPPSPAPSPSPRTVTVTLYVDRSSVGWPEGITPSGSHRSVRDSLPSYGSCRSDRWECRFHPYPMREVPRLTLGCVPHDPSGLLPGSEALVLLHDPPQHVGVDTVEHGIQRRAVECPIVRHPPSHHRIDHPCEIGRRVTSPPMQSPGPHLLTDLLQGTLADRWEKTRKLHPIGSSRFAWLERVAQGQSADPRQAYPEGR